MSELEITPTLVLSTGHIDPESMCFGDLRTSEHEYGYITFLPELETEEAYDLEIPDWFKPVVELARKHGCGYILFDRDGPMVAKLKAYDW